MNFFTVSDIQRWPSDLGPTSLMIGNFDGVHRGHQQLIKASTEWASRHHGISVALTFQPHPLAVLSPKPGYARLFSLQDRGEQLQKHGASGMLVQEFSRAFSAMSAQSFMGDYLLKSFYPRQIVVGQDFGFGQGREGNIQSLKSFCQKNQIELAPIPAFKLDEEVVSSSSIRQALREGNVEKAKFFLGRAFYLRGSVVNGDQRGRRIGFPTANLGAFEQQVPRLGVYATTTTIGEKKYSSVTNIGVNPTFQSHEPLVKVETHLLNFSQDIYGKEIQVEFNHYLRSEKKFSSVEELKSQIQKDIQLAEKKADS